MKQNQIGLEINFFIGEAPLFHFDFVLNIKIKKITVKKCLIWITSRKLKLIKLVHFKVYRLWIIKYSYLKLFRL